MRLWKRRSGVELVFRSVGERTRDLALELAEKHVRPDALHLIEQVRPHSAAIDAMLALDLRCEVVVIVDADCLILEDLRTFVEKNRDPYIAYRVEDRFRGRLAMGVHVYLRSLLKDMRRVQVKPDDLAYVLRAETRLRRLALERIGKKKTLADARILHDHFQSYEDVFAKYGQRELRSRSKERQRAELESAMTRWGDDPDLLVARAAVAHARAAVPEGAPAERVRRYILALPWIAEAEVKTMALPPQEPLGREEVSQRAAEYGWTV